MFRLKIKKFIFIVFCILIIYQTQSSSQQLAANKYSINKYSDMIDKLLFFKNDRFKVFYGGPITLKTKQGLKWIMPALFLDENYKTRALYDLLFVNCDPKNAKDAKILFLNVNDIDIKFKNLLSNDYAIFDKIIKNKYSKHKYIVIRKTDFGMIYYPDLFIASAFSKYYDEDKNTITKFLHHTLGASNSYKEIFNKTTKDRLLQENENNIIYEPIPIKTKINGQIYSYFITKVIIKKDQWKLYYIITKNREYKNFSKDPVLLRLDSGCVTGQIYSDESCDCADQLYDAVQSMIQHKGFAILVHIPGHDGRGFGTALKAETELYKLGITGRINKVAYPLDTVEAAKLLYGSNDYDLRTFDGAAKILKEIGINNVLLITDNVVKTQSLEKKGIKVTRLKTNSNKQSCIQHLLSKRKSNLYYSE